MTGKLTGEVYAYIDTTDSAEYLGIVEELHMKLPEMVAETGTTLALPARTLYAEQGASAGLTVP